MKKLSVALVSTALLLVSGLGNSVSAQGKFGADSARCVEYLTYYTMHYKQKNYDVALPHWRNAFFKYCPPTANHNMFIDGMVMYRRLIAKNAVNKELRQGLIDTLLMLHDLRAKTYTKYAKIAANNKGTDISNFYRNEEGKMYAGLEGVIETLGKDVKPSLLLFDIDAAIKMFKNGSPDIDPEKIISLYQRNIAILGEIEPKNDKEKETIAKVKSDIEGLFMESKVASCDNLIALFTPRFEANPEDVTLAANIAKLLASADDCVNNDLFLQATTLLHKDTPSAQSAYFLYRLNAARDNDAEAGKFLEEAVSLASGTDSLAAADYGIQYARFCAKKGQNAKAVANAQKAASLNPAFAGQAFFIIGQIWGTTSCGGDEISRRAPYWVAVDYMNKAKAADPTLAEDCNKMIAQYKVYFPQTAEAFMYDLTDGKSYTVSCGGMTATTTVRTQK